MNKYRILFAVGEDRPGIVEDISTFLFDRNANIEESRMASLGGRFSIMCLFSCTEEKLSNIESGTEHLSRAGLEVSFHDADDPTTLEKKAHLPLHLEVVSMDHPGIVQKIVHILKEHNINIHSLETRLKAMPHSGAPLFDLDLEADVPAEITIGKVKEELNELALDMNLDILFHG